MKNKGLLTVIAIITIAMSAVAQDATFGNFTDSRDGKSYKTIKIGAQTWMAENLAYKSSSGCMAYDNLEANAKTYGYLYNFEVATKACPSGWHLPSEKEWATLTEYLGGDSLAHDKLKEKGTAHWKEADASVTNASKFTALPGGLYNYSAFRKTTEFKYLGTYGYWWGATTQPGEGNNLNASFRVLGDYYKNEKPDYASKSRGSSVRCVKD
jgi:uncharacterized protein (TIGR02145 family)